MNIEETQWAKDFKNSSPLCYQKDIEYATRPKLRVIIIDINDYEIVAIDDHDPDYDCFWMDSKPSKEEAVALCNDMGLEIVEEYGVSNTTMEAQ